MISIVIVPVALCISSVFEHAPPAIPDINAKMRKVIRTVATTMIAFTVPTLKSASIFMR